MGREKEKSELDKKAVLRLNNEEAKKLTRECFQMALIYLMNEKPFDQISVTDLVKRSGVSRTAFYRHYKAKEDILESIRSGIEAKLTAIIEKNKGQQTMVQGFKECFDFVRENRKTIKLMLGAGMSRESLFHNTSLLEKIHPSDTYQKHYVKLASESAFSRIVVEWFITGMKESTESMAALCEHLFSGIEKIIF